MPSNLENLEAIKSNYLTVLAADSVSPQPSYSIDGQSVNRDQWRDSLMAKIKDINDLIQFESTTNEPFEFHTRGFS